ncbi:hypothetical protein SADUNF_Sadunf01G0016500 [Salix dunnii]|uniref:Uncharacterized protein n=1 Tax=Salix dunnii TaxID=1413687 RepID=A0A835TIP8_9ROSI|nr:hypothetical protein SADUNF_Sadunf01G0016500 [Salix dunnii]
MRSWIEVVPVLFISSRKNSNSLALETITEEEARDREDDKVFSGQLSRSKAKYVGPTSLKNQSNRITSVNSNRHTRGKISTTGNPIQLMTAKHTHTLPLLLLCIDKISKQAYCSTSPSSPVLPHLYSSPTLK